jgi:hypothetical protein
MRGIVGFVWFDDSKTRGAVERCRRQTVKKGQAPILGEPVFLRSLFLADE